MANNRAKRRTSVDSSERAATKPAPGRGRVRSDRKDGPPLNLPEGDSDEIEPARLLLDPGNLRLMEAVDEKIRKTPARLIGQESIQLRMDDIIRTSPQFALDELISSIKYNGFLKHERLIVARYGATRLLVLEGNRRLCAVRQIYKEFGRGLKQLRPDVQQSLETLPCFVLKGEPIDGSEIKLALYRRAAEIYIGMRHLMQAKSWEPASRYEFQANLLQDDGWTVEQVAERFGRTKGAVVRDLMAQTLYHEFRRFESSRGIQHKLTYNAFAEAARAPAVRSWMGWSQKEMKVSHKDHLNVFFEFLLGRVKSPDVTTQEADEDSPRETAKEAVKLFKDMLILSDTDVSDALIDRQFDRAIAIYYDRREGDLDKRVERFMRTLRRVTYDEFSHNPRKTRDLLQDLVDQVQGMIKSLDGILKKES